MTPRLYLLCLMLAASGAAAAQEPTVPVTTGGVNSSRAALPASEKARIDERFRGLQADIARHAATSPDEVKPPPSEITLAPGVPSIFAIARHHLNRLVTPFAHPVVKTTSTASTSVESNIVYVSTDTRDPVSFYVYDKGNPDQALSVSMVPADIPPVSVTLHLLGYASTDHPRVLREGSEDVAEGWEVNQPFLSGLKSSFRDIALGKVPDGYSLSTLPRSATAVRGCFIPGVTVEARQLLKGYNVDVVVAKVTNASRVVREIDERDCAHDERVLAVAVWPIRSLVPGDSAEMYIAMRAASHDTDDTQRPSLLGGSR